MKNIAFQSGYSDVNGLKMYYEIHGEGDPVVLIHGGGSTIETTFGNVIRELAANRKVIAIELQAHGRTSDRNADLSFEQDADDVAALLGNLGIKKADFFGFSNGGTTALQIAIRHPEIANKLVLSSVLAKRDGIFTGFFDFMKTASLGNMPVQLQAAFLKVNPDKEALQTMHDRDAKRMVNFKDIPDDQLKAIKAEVLLINGDIDVILSEHAVFLQRTIPGAQLAIIPGGHGEYIGEATTQKNEKIISATLSIIENFLN